jgi:DNA polymerase-3 subunit delta'
MAVPEGGKCITRMNSQIESSDEIPDIDGDQAPRFTKALIGHQSACQTMLQACQGARFPHAWLLSGPKGVGKASFAYLLARSLMAAKRPQDMGEFWQAQDSADGHLVETDAHPDMFVLKRRYNEKTDKFYADIPADDVRELKKSFSLSAARSGWRIAIVDSIDDMNKFGVNGLLKLLEEPPEKCLFFIICHNPGRLLDTIKSRCRSLTFNALTTDELTRLITGHAASIDPNEAAAAAYLAAGSAGRALNLVEHGGMELYRDLIDVLVGLPNPDIERLHALASRFGARAAPESFDVFCYLFSNWLYRLIHGRATGSYPQPVFEGEADLIDRIGPQMALEPATRLWEKVNQDARQTGALNLDKKQAVLDWIDALSELT